MLKLFTYEFKKQIFRVSLLIIAVLCLVVNCYKQYETVRYYGADGYIKAVMGETPDSEKLYQDFKGDLDQELFDRINAYTEELNAVIAEGKFSMDKPSDEFFTGYVYGDLNYLNMLKDEVRYAYMYPNTMAEISEKARECISFYEGSNDYLVKENELILSIYQGRSISAFGRYETFTLFFDYEFSTFAILILMAFVFASSFAAEKATGNDRIIRSCGRAGSVFRAKHMVMYLFVICAVIIFALVDLLGFGRYYGFEFMEQPLYAIQSYQYTPVDISIAGTIIISLVFRILFLIFIGEVLLLISTFTKNIGLALTVSFAAAGAMIFINSLIPEYLSPFSLLSVKTLLGSFRCVNIFGLPVPSYLIAPAVTLVLTIILHIICYFRAVGRTELRKRRISE